ncbi:MAG: hypothetical protein IIC51_07100, partial [Planctomycetes bacterium]|nr:hypothetical protein [Planctomycetota bacterium]
MSSQTGGVYSTGSMVRIDIVEGSGEEDIVDGTIRITSASTGYDSGLQPLSFGSIFYNWDTTGLEPASDYLVDVTLTDAAGQTTTATDALTVILTPNPPLINKLVSELDLSFPSRRLPVRILRTYLLDSDFDGPLGYGWTHSYRMRITETQESTATPGGLVPTPGLVQVFNADGTGSFFLPNGDGTYESPKGDFRTLTMLSNGVFRLQGKYGTVLYFSGNGKLFHIEDRNGNAVTLQYDSTDI